MDPGLRQDHLFAAARDRRSFESIPTRHLPCARMIEVDPPLSFLRIARSWGVSGVRSSPPSIVPIWNDHQSARALYRRHVKLPGIATHSPDLMDSGCNCLPVSLFFYGPACCGPVVEPADQEPSIDPL